MIRNSLGIYVPVMAQIPKWRAALLEAVSGDTSLLPAESNQGRLRQLEAASALGADMIEQADSGDIAKIYEWIVELGQATPYDESDVEEELAPLDALSESDERELAALADEA